MDLEEELMHSKQVLRTIILRILVLTRVVTQMILQVLERIWLSSSGVSVAFRNGALHHRRRTTLQDSQVILHNIVHLQETHQ